MISNNMDYTTVPSENVSYNFSNRTDGIAHEGNSMPSFLKEEQITFLVFLLIAIIVGNLIVLVAVVISHRKTRMTFFIMHLAIADLLVGVFSVLPDLIWRITELWYAGDALCRVVKFLQCLVTYGSTFVLVALSIDRLDAIARPLNFSRSWRRCKILIAVAWGIAAIFSSPSLILFQLEHNECNMNLESPVYWQVYITLIAFVVFFIPAFIITFCYGAIICVIWRHNKVLHSINQTKADRHLEKPLYPKDGLKQHNSMNATSRLRCGRQTSVSSRGIIPQAKIRTVKMTFAIVIVFIICWSPYFIWNLLSVYRVITYDSNAVRLASIFIQSLAPLNSAANPIIYGIFSTRICRYLRRFRIIKNLTETFPCCDGQDRDVSRRDKHSTYTATEVTDFSVSKNYTRCARSKDRQRYTGVQRSFDSSSERTLVERPQSVEMCDLILSSNGAI